jgi:hypothetical protein
VTPNSDNGLANNTVYNNSSSHPPNDNATVVEVSQEFMSLVQLFNARPKLPLSTTTELDLLNTWLNSIKNTTKLVSQILVLQI